MLDLNRAEVYFATICDEIINILYELTSQSYNLADAVLGDGIFVNFLHQTNLWDRYQWVLWVR